MLEAVQEKQGTLPLVVMLTSEHTQSKRNISLTSANPPAPVCHGSQIQQPSDTQQWPRCEL